MLSEIVGAAKRGKERRLKGGDPSISLISEKRRKKERFFNPPIRKKEKKQKRMEGKEVRTKVGEE